MRKTNTSTISDLLSLGETALNVLMGAVEHRRNDNAHTKGCLPLDLMAHKLNLVTRDEFDAAFAMIKKARTMQNDLLQRIEAIEGKMTLSTPVKTQKKKTIRRKS